MSRSTPESELIGRTFNYLTLKKKYTRTATDGLRRSFWECQCVCGKIVSRRQDYILTGKTHSCGCKHPRHWQRETNTQWKGCGMVSGQYFSSLQHGAKNRKLEFAISIEYVWKLFEEQGGRCALSGLPLKFGEGAARRSRSGQTASLDRKDPSIGYVEGNVWWVHKVVNQMRNHFDLSVFLGVCRAVAHHLPGYVDQALIDSAKGTRNASTKRCSTSN